MSLVNIVNVSMNALKKKTYQERYFVSYLSKQLVLFVLLPMNHKRRSFYNCIDSGGECSTKYQVLYIEPTGCYHFQS